MRMEILKILVGDILWTVPRSKKERANKTIVVKVIEHDPKNPLKNSGCIEAEHVDVVGWIHAPHYKWERYFDKSR